MEKKKEKGNITPADDDVPSSSSSQVSPFFVKRKA